MKIPKTDSNNYIMQLKNSRDGIISISNDTNAERRKKPPSQISNLEDLKFGLFLERILSS